MTIESFEFGVIIVICLSVVPAFGSVNVQMSERDGRVLVQQMQKKMVFLQERDRSP